MPPTITTNTDSQWDTGFIESFAVKPGRTVDLRRDFDPAFKPDGASKALASDLLTQSLASLTEYQERLAAQKTHGVLVILQALDAAGKDGTIRHVMRGVNPQGVHVHSFKAPSPEELTQDFLRRYQERLPKRGEIGIFNRSHYEEVLVVRVHPQHLENQNLPPANGAESVWERRYRAINEWERYLSENGIRVVKLFLNLSKEEQRIRFLRRCDIPDRNWKFSANDVYERRYWDQYQTVFSEMLSHTSTPWAPWHVIPADRKWFARVASAAVIVDVLRDIDPRFPVASPEEIGLLAQARAKLELEAPLQQPLG